MGDTSVKLSPSIEIQEMIDVVFDLQGSSVPEGYPFTLWAEIVRFLPWLNEEKNAGILPLRGSISDDNLLLSKRSKLILRLPVARASQAAQLSGKQLNIKGSVLTMGSAKQRPLVAATTLHAHMVESKLDEVAFLAEMKSQLEHMNISCNLICDKHRNVQGDQQALSGFGLVLHDLKPIASLQIQRTGLSGSRKFGCGIFIPFKAITGLDSE